MISGSRFLNVPKYNLEQRPKFVSYTPLNILLADHCKMPDSELTLLISTLSEELSTMGTGGRPPARNLPDPGKVVVCGFFQRPMTIFKALLRHLKPKSPLVYKHRFPSAQSVYQLLLVLSKSAVFDLQDPVIISGPLGLIGTTKI